LHFCVLRKRVLSADRICNLMAVVTKAFSRNWFG
jgi:hypothetical protein